MGLFADLGSLFQADVLLFLTAGTFFGIIIGILPGIGGAVALALLIPITIGFSKEAAIALLISAYCASNFGGSVTAILINTPGDPVNAATALDGYPLAKQGKAMSAITASLFCSAAGGLVGLIAIALMIPIARELVLMLSYPDFFMLAIFGLAIIARLAHGNIFYGLISVLLGLLISFIGTDPITGGERFTFEVRYLWDGIDTLPVIIGLFAMSEAFLLASQKNAIAGESVVVSGYAGIIDGLKAVFRHFWLFLRSCFIGIYIGIIPGVGGVVASLMAYGLAAQSSRTPERFGKGAIEGVIASESANDAKEAGALLPTLAFGIPGSAGMAVLAGGLVLHGITPGPELITRYPGTVGFIIFAAAAAKILAMVVTFLIGIRLVWFTKVPGRLMAPAIIVISLTGAYSFNGSIGDMIVATVFGAVGVVMQKYGFSRIGFVIALILGHLVESSYHSTLTVFGYSGFITRPVALILLMLTIITLLSPVLSAKRRRAKERAS